MHGTLRLMMIVYQKTHKNTVNTTIHEIYRNLKGSVIYCKNMHIKYQQIVCGLLLRAT